MRRARLLGVLVVAGALVACSADDAPPAPDAGPRQDAGLRDAGALRDGGPQDGGTPHDAGTPDSGPRDGGTHDAAPAPCAFTWCDDGAPLPSDTPAELAAFYAQRGDRSIFPTHYVDAVELLLEVEDHVVAGRYADARARLDAHFTTYPLYDPIWRQEARRAGANVGDPIAYYGLRMLDEIARVGAGTTAPDPTPIRFLVVLAPCSRGQRPSSPDFSTGEMVEGTLDPRVAADDYRVLRESVRLFTHYVWAITVGALRIELAVQETTDCAAVSFSPGDNPSYGFSGITRAQAALETLTPRQRAQVDMYWVLYPSNVPEGPGFDDVAYITGGMSGFEGRPLFIIDDLWVIRNPAHLGSGPMSTVERRVYLPQWLQHEFFHYLFGTYPQFALETTSHQWFDRNTWPPDFEGAWEPDYYAEALAKRLRGAMPPLAEALLHHRPFVDVSHLGAEALVGDYERRPIENGYHEVSVTLEAGELFWTNRSNVRWRLFWSNGALRTGADCPYGEQTLGVLASDVDGTVEVDALVFLGENYVRPD